MTNTSSAFIMILVSEGQRWNTEYQSSCCIWSAGNWQFHIWIFESCLQSTRWIKYASASRCVVKSPIAGRVRRSGWPEQGYLLREAVGVQWWIPGRRKPSRKTHIAEMFALNCTELPGAAIDACGAGISLRGISVAAGMTEVKPIMHSALTVEKSTYNGSSRWK